MSKGSRMHSESHYHKTREPYPFSMSKQFVDMELDDCLVIKIDGVNLTVGKVRSSIQNAKVGMESKGTFRRFASKHYPEEGILRVWRIK